MTDFEITKLENNNLQKDYPQIVSLLEQLYPKNEPLDFSEFQKVVENPVNNIFVAKINDKIIGIGTIVCYNKLGGKVCVIEDVVVSENYRKKGIGRELVNFLLKKAKDYGANFVDVNTRRSDAKDFYAKLGFKEKGIERAFYALRYYF